MVANQEPRWCKRTYIMCLYLPPTWSVLDPHMGDYCIDHMLGRLNTCITSRWLYNRALGRQVINYYYGIWWWLEATVLLLVRPGMQLFVLT